MNAHLVQVLKPSVPLLPAPHYVPVDLTFAHHERNPSHAGDVVEWVAFGGHQICLHSRSNAADAIADYHPVVVL